MAEAPPPLVFDTGFSANPGLAVPVVDGVVRVTAGNGGPYTFTGTNSFILGGERVAVLDPGPDDAGHRNALVAAIGGRAVEAILLTHTHKDHSAGAWALQAATGAPLWFAGPHRLSRPARLFEINRLAGECDWGLTPDRTLFDGEVFEIGGVSLVAHATPGHCANHMSFGLPAAEALFTGDHVMGWNSTLVAVPDGSMADYLVSLQRVMGLPYWTYHPAHGGPIADGVGYGRALLAHRELRNRQITGEVSNGASTVGELLRRIYPMLKGKLRMAAAMTLEAHIEYLAERGEIRARRTLMGRRLSPG